MMEQYLEIKDAHRDELLFYRMGDFYEMFFDDAVAAAEALDIALTKRGKHLGDDIAMCGVPVHSAERYLLALIRKGFRVAVCEQLEDPAEAKMRGAKSVVKRGVVRLVTPGTLTEAALLDARAHNYLAAFAQVRDTAALAWADISTGAFNVMQCTRDQLLPELARLAPREVLLSEGDFSDLAELVTDIGAAATPMTRASFDSTGANRRLAKFYKVSTLDAFGGFERAETAAMGAILTYLELTQRGNMPLLRPPVRGRRDRAVQIDAATRRNLELTHSIGGGRDGSLRHVIDRTITAAGARLLEHRLASPSAELDEITSRLDALACFDDNPSLREDVRKALRGVPDIDRALSRLGLERGGPRDLGAIRDGMGQAAEISTLIPDDTSAARLTDARRALLGFDALVTHLQRALVEEPPHLARDGGFMAPDYDHELDEARKLRDEGRGLIAGLQGKYAKLTGISSLKIKHNNVLGYFVETPATHASKMLAAPLDETFIHRQTTANSVRFATAELAELASRILNSGKHALDIERQLYARLAEEILDAAPNISAAADALAEIDTNAALAELASQNAWTRPDVDQSRAFEITGGRHPVVEAALARQDGTPFVANDCNLTAVGQHAAIWLLTGPNMAGKSTFLRQNCLIAILAQMGSYVPARRAKIGLVSQIFSRVGASDDLARGRSTFMVEMIETAAILNQADDRALVILDEIGRGTATYDGLSIAWATLEHLHEINRCRTLFATHYHEMTRLADGLPGATNATVAVKEWEGEVVFLHEVRKGAADRSYGVQVAKLAGLPAAVINRARQVLDILEKGDRQGATSALDLVDDLPLFSAVPAAGSGPSTQLSALQERMENINPDEVSPKDALGLLYELKALTTSGLS